MPDEELAAILRENHRLLSLHARFMRVSLRLILHVRGMAMGVAERDQDYYAKHLASSNEAVEELLSLLGTEAGEPDATK